MSPHQSAHINLLFSQGRFAEAEGALRSVLAGDPDNSEALLLMAIALYRLDRDEEALGAVMVALRSDPDNTHALSWKSRIHLSIGQTREAMDAAQQAIFQDPQDPFHWISKALVHADARDWKSAENAARTALELDPDDESAHHVLSQALLYQGKARENEFNIGNRLAEDPNNPIAHCNAGFAALRARQHKKASQHFAEALRIDPECAMARDGLIESFRARSFIYRSYLAFAMRMAAYSKKYGAALGIGIYLVYQVLRRALEAVDKRLSTALIFLYLTFVFWSYVARGLSTFFLLADPFARMALRFREKLEGVVVGGGFLIGFLLSLTGFFLNLNPVMWSGFVLLGQSIPASLYFDSDTKLARRIYGAFAYTTWICGFLVLANLWLNLLPSKLSGTAIVVGGISITVATFCAVFGVGRRG